MEKTFDEPDLYTYLFLSWCSMNPVELQNREREKKWDRRPCDARKFQRSRWGRRWREEATQKAMLRYVFPFAATGRNKRRGREINGFPSTWSHHQLAINAHCWESNQVPQSSKPVLRDLNTKLLINEPRHEDQEFKTKTEEQRWRRNS